MTVIVQLDTTFRSEEMQNRMKSSLLSKWILAGDMVRAVSLISSRQDRLRVVKELNINTQTIAKLSSYPNLVTEKLGYLHRYALDGTIDQVNMRYRAIVDIINDIDIWDTIRLPEIAYQCFEQCYLDGFKALLSTGRYFSDVATEGVMYFVKCHHDAIVDMVGIECVLNYWNDVYLNDPCTVYHLVSARGCDVVPIETIPILAGVSDLYLDLFMSEDDSIRINRYPYHTIYINGLYDTTLAIYNDDRAEPIVEINAQEEGDTIIDMIVDGVRYINCVVIDGVRYNDINDVKSHPFSLLYSKLIKTEWMQQFDYWYHPDIVCMLWYSSHTPAAKFILSDIGIDIRDFYDTVPTHLALSLTPYEIGDMDGQCYDTTGDMENWNHHDIRIEIIDDANVMIMGMVYPISNAITFNLADTIIGIDVLLELNAQSRPMTIKAIS